MKDRMNLDVEQPEDVKGKIMKSIVSYQVYALEHKNKLHGKYPFLKAHQINMKLKSMWNNLPKEEKNNYRKFTLISTPTPPKKPAKKTSTPSGKGRLLTPKVCRKRLSEGNTARTTKIDNFDQREPSITDDRGGSVMLGPYYNSDDEISAGESDPDSPETRGKSSLGLPWENEIKTYDGPNSVEKNYPVPKIIGSMNAQAETTPGILKRKGSESKKPPSRVSFSNEDVEVKIMSEMEDSCSTLSASQEPTLKLCNTDSTLEENPYDFDVIDQFEICVTTPEKSKQTSKFHLDENPKETGIKVTHKRSVESKKLSPGVVPAKRMLRSRSSSVSKFAIPCEKLGNHYINQPDGKSSPCVSGGNGRGDAAETFQSSPIALKSIEKMEALGLRQNMFVTEGGDNQTPCQNKNGGLKNQITPTMDIQENTTKTAQAPKKRKQRTRTGPQRTPTQVSSKLYISADNNLRRSPRFLSQSPADNQKEGNKSSSSKDNGCGKLTEHDKSVDDVSSKPQGTFQHLFEVTSKNNDRWSKGLSNCPSKIGDILDNNSDDDSDNTLSPVLLQAKSRMSVAETLRGLKMITSPDNPDFSDSSTDCPKLLSPTLSDISVLSSISSNSGKPLGNENCFIKQAAEDNKETEVGKSNEASKKAPTFMKTSRKENKPMKVPIPRNTIREPLCDMFQNVTPPEETILSSSRRLLPSSGFEGESNFESLFEEEDIFG